MLGRKHRRVLAALLLWLPILTSPVSSQKPPDDEVIGGNCRGRWSIVPGVCTYCDWAGLPPCGECRIAGCV